MHVIFEPLDFIARLAALMPKPIVNLTRFHGIFASTPGGLPAGDYESGVVIQDRRFDTYGQLLIPDGYPAGLNGGPPTPDVHPFRIPEFFGDTLVVIGKTWPYMNDVHSDDVETVIMPPPIA